MARGDKEYFRVEVAFVEGPEFRRLSPEAYKLYVVLQSRCIATRRTVLYGLDCSWMAAQSGLKPQRIPHALRELSSTSYGSKGNPLIFLEGSPEQGPNNHRGRSNLYTIKVEGMDRNNAKFKWEPSPYDPHRKSQVHLLPDRNGTEHTHGERGTNGDHENPLEEDGVCDLGTGEKEKKAQEMIRKILGSGKFNFDQVQVERFISRHGARMVLRVADAANREGVRNPVAFFLSRLEAGDVPATREERKFWGDS